LISFACWQRSSQDILTRRITVKLYKWDEMPEEHVHELFSRRFISGEQMTMARIFLKKGCLVPTHNHESEQLTTVFTGALKFLIDGNEIIVRGGETSHSAFVYHSAEAIEDTQEGRLSPIRSDWIEDGRLSAPKA
jgi:quercetin dioxygenase-like cupin family protein